MASKNFIKPLVLTTVDGAVIAIDTWTAFDAGGIEEACYMLRITNDSDADIFFSYDGVNRHEFLAADKTVDIYFQTNSSPSNHVSKVRKGTVIYVQGTAAQAGDIYLSGYYNEIM